ncbi:hypothetical protein L9F63_023838, partial [Diploptera punctata]
FNSYARSNSYGIDDDSFSRSIPMTGPFLWSIPMQVNSYGIDVNSYEGIDVNSYGID